MVKQTLKRLRHSEKRESQRQHPQAKAIILYCLDNDGNNNSNNNYKESNNNNNNKKQAFVAILTSYDWHWDCVFGIGNSQGCHM